MVMTMANGWRSKEEIKAEYGYSEGTFNARMNECYCSDFADAIISDTSKFSTSSFLNGVHSKSVSKHYLV